MDEETRKAAVLRELNDNPRLTLNAVCKKLNITPKLIYRYANRDDRFNRDLLIARGRQTGLDVPVGALITEIARKRVANNGKRNESTTSNSYTIADASRNDGNRR